MDTGTTVGLVIAVIAALIAIGVLIWAARSRGDAKRRERARELREQLRHEDAEVRDREAMATQTEARARAAKAEADAKAAEAQRLANAAQGQRSDVAASREELEKRRAHADALDPQDRRHSPDARN